MLGIILKITVKLMVLSMIVNQTLANNVYKNDFKDLEHNKVDKRISALYEGATTVASIYGMPNVASMAELLAKKEDGCVFDGRSYTCISFETMQHMPKSEYIYLLSVSNENAKNKEEQTTIFLSLGGLDNSIEKIKQAKNIMRGGYAI